MLKKLVSLNDKLIEQNKDNDRLYKKHILIKEIFHKNDCFLNMDIEIAYSILRDLLIPEEDIKEIYMNLINPYK